MPTPKKKLAATTRSVKEAKKHSEATESSKIKPGATPQHLRGMKDILPAEQKYWQFVRKQIDDLAGAYGFERIDTPILEETGLFVRTAGKTSDVIEKELFTFDDRGGDSVSLRPEGTASVARAYINHGMFNLPQPVKMYYVGQMFRYERPQSGRYREHWQFGLEAFGDASPALDAEVILLATLFYKGLGIKTTVSINSIGCTSCRPGYIAELLSYYKTKRAMLCEDCKRRMVKNPLRLLDCKEEGCQPIKAEAPQIVDHLDEECKTHFMRVLEFLDELQVPYSLNPQLVRGLDYYNRTVFELMLAEEGVELSHALGGGGRYDGLVELLGGRPTPACGFGIGLERAISQMRGQNIEPPDTSKTEIFLAQLGDAARRKSFLLFEDLRMTGVRVGANFAKNSLKGQLEIANRLGAKFTVILGQKEVIDGTIIIRDMESGMQEIVDYAKATAELRKKLGK
jgi:histidyl-tRNA synthetase